MAEATATEPMDELSVRRLFPKGMMAVGLAVLIFALIGAFRYSGVMEKLAEWQFAHFGRYHPALTVLALVLLAALAWRIIWWLVSRDRSVDDPQWQMRRDVAMLDAARVAMYAIAMLSAVFTLGAFVQWLQLPSDDGKAAQVSVSTASRMREGPLQLTDVRAIGPVARYREGVLWWGRPRYLFPVGQRIINGQPHYDLFVALRPDARRPLDVPTLSSTRTGVVRRNALPDEIAVMYAANRHPVTADAAVVYENASEASRSTLFFMAEAFAVGVVSVLFAFFIARRAKRLARQTG